MATTLIEIIRQNLGYPQPQKVDPNIQETKDKHEQSPVEKMAQAAIPAVLAALYTMSRTEDGCNNIIGGKQNADWLSILYKGKEQEAVSKVAVYAGIPAEQADGHMENIADEAVRVIKESAGNDAAKVKKYMTDERHDILVHLPAALKMGDVLNDESLDDRTNKMEGPISNFMHKIEKTLSDGDRKEGLF